MVSVCLPSDALLQHLPSYLGFSYLGRGVSLHGCASKTQPLFLTLDEGYLLTTTIPDLQHGIAPLGPPVPVQPPLLGLLLLATGPGYLYIPCSLFMITVKQFMAKTILEDFSQLYQVDSFTRSSGCAVEGGPRGTIPRSRSGGPVVRRYPSSKVRSSSCARLEEP